MRRNFLSIGLLCVSALRSNWPSNGGKLSGTFVHITDLHLQGDYEIGPCRTLRVPLVRASTRQPRLSDSCHCAGSNTDCGQPICCRAEGGVGRAGHQAGIFGDWACDLAPRMARSLFDAISALDPVLEGVVPSRPPAHSTLQYPRYSTPKARAYSDYCSGCRACAGGRITVPTALLHRFQTSLSTQAMTRHMMCTASASSDHTPRSSSGGVAATAPAASATAEHPLALQTAPQQCVPQQILAAKLGPDECSWAQTHELNLHAISSVTQLQASRSVGRL